MSLHRRSRELAEAIQRVEGGVGREAADKEVAKELGISMEDYYHLLQETSSSKMVSLDEILAAGGGGSNTIDGGCDDRLQRDQFRQRLGEEIRNLPERESLVLALYYDKELNLKEIGSVLNVSESRISQIMSQAHARLRARLVDYGER